jgi:hypothetical protein
LEVDNRKVPFLFHKDAYKEDDDKDFIIIRNSIKVPKFFEIIVKENGLSFSIVKTRRGITIIKIISISVK